MPVPFTPTAIIDSPRTFPSRLPRGRIGGNRTRFWILSFSLLFAWTIVGDSSGAWAWQTPGFSNFETTTREKRREIQAAVSAAFAVTHQGFSSDEVLLQDELQNAFQTECQQRLPEVQPEIFNWVLLNLRKQGRLTDVPTTRRSPTPSAAWRPLAEIAARTVQDQHQLSLDRIFCVPALRNDFDRRVQAQVPEADLDEVRRAAFQLRKARQLKPELITRLADWGREVQSYSLAELRSSLDQISAGPGVYIFSDRAGYLYIGEADNLRRRLKTHLDESDRKSLAQYLQREGAEEVSIELHTFDPESRIRELSVRRAYESELIRSRQPRLNIRP